MRGVRDVFAAELIKIRSVRSTYWTLLTVPVVCGALGYLVGSSARSALASGPDASRGVFDPGFLSFYGITLGQIPLVVFAVLVAGAEYSSGTVHVSLTAVPRRGVFYAAKVLATAAIVLPVSLLGTAAVYIAARTGLGPYAVGLAEAGMARAAAGACLYLTLIALLSTGVAAALRSSAFSLGVLLPLLFLGSQGLGNAPGVKIVAQYLPDQAGTLILYTTPLGGQFARPYGAWTGVAILAAWTAAALLAGHLVTSRR
ncbi:ABC transporter permease subunit [Sphaerisporangium rubeum]|uniref:ABC-type transport system involved in multi-copper enzyme maturation permease subunit n=1 Tax=Sphaerisporangium rubeum TaxID=321317 RepID=A0A7X0IC17_9ACTN|nr:ABC transporter permease [Sphaerisporangium rubeum]MBB6471744.1 ABC-type transport system involved in multi-copper enzyme maturation permease subunit [Sphaerisporangium rubeum]